MQPPPVARVLLADDHRVVRRGLCMIIDAEPDLQVVAQADDGLEAVQTALETDVDLAILDVAMPRMTGLQAARRVLEQRPHVRIVMLSMHDNEQFCFEALRVGAAGYVLKSAAEDDLVAACRAALRGEPFLYPQAVDTLIRAFLDHGDDAADPLTPRETEVLKLVAEGHSSREIAELLHIAEKTVERHRSNILEKLRLRDRVALTRYAMRHGLIEP